MSEGKIERTLLRDNVQGVIQRAILDHTLEPGERLHDDELAAWVGTSKSPVREALTALADIGLVEMVPNRLTRVAPVDLQRFQESMEIVAALTVRGVVLGAGCFPADGLDELRRLRAVVAAEPIDADGLSEAGAEALQGMADTVFAECGNPVLTRLIADQRLIMQHAKSALPRAVPAAVAIDIADAIVDACARNEATELDALIARYRESSEAAIVQRAARELDAAG